ncbi:HutD/Ves family protein [Paraburkholderia caballeronis]|uniref:HutD/Ves family protein n=1 Tax=Paraburkholderia caballeronis TaxID=416943 RepID=UPI001065F0DB|nr:HutD family protein [Paraburkholderia caballeronis]TDV09181.1 hypothetical protein C7408_1162 [Paraburkholderia caballeronis]TDV12241.1 hypothetical protein C7406_1172 [Paraburkholderia caballeronis]TDV22714.1 hypothetical protein C7404_1162 [Paraburkholderia caballeronis]
MSDAARIDCLALAAEAWANGSGATRTLGRCNDEDGETAWRVSIATLNGPSRFSQFPGVDRTFILIDQESVELQLQHGSLHARLGQPVHFSGDLHVWIDMPAGEAHALNVMTRRGRCRARVEVMSHDAIREPAQTHFLVSLGGAWLVRGAQPGDGGITLAPLHALRLDGHAGRLELSPADAGSNTLLASIAIETAETASA